MTLKYQTKESNIYLNNSDVPQNKLNITNSEEIHEIERILLEKSYKTFISELKENTIFDEDYFKSIHRRTFSSLYDWAGIYRNNNISKGNTLFCLGSNIENSSKKIFKDLKQDNYLRDFQNQNKIDFAKKLAYYKCELMALHPFNEINGRTLRLFIDMLANYNNYKLIDYSNIKDDEYIQASKECVQFANSDNLERIILNGLRK